MQVIRTMAVAAALAAAACPAGVIYVLDNTKDQVVSENITWSNALVGSILVGNAVNRMHYVDGPTYIAAVGGSAYVLKASPNWTGSAIKVQPAAERSTYGQKIHDYHNTELCRAIDDACYQTGASSTGDAWCGLAQMDSNMGDRSNAVFRFATLATDAEAEAAKALSENRPANPDVGDASIGAVWLHFEDLDDCLRRGCGVGLPPGEEAIHPWLDPAWIRGRCKQMTRGEFLRNHCNLPTGAGEVLWTEEQISPLFRRIPKLIPPEKLAAAVGAFDGRMAVGVGLDRAGAFSKDPDRTSLAAVGRLVIPALAGLPLPVYGPKGEVIETEVTDGSIYLLLGIWTFAHALRDPLQAKLLEIDKTWGIGHVCLESYQASDLGEWCQRQRFGDRSDICHMTAQAKQQLVHFMHGLVMMRRFWASQEHAILRAEFLNYREDATGAIPSFYGPRTTADLDVPQPDGSAVRETTWIKDDELESVFWAVHAARQARTATRGRVLEKPRGL